MATHAHSTRTPLLPLSGRTQPLLGTGSGRQLGPVSQAIRAMRAADPASAAFEAQIGGNPFDRQAETASRFTADAAIRALRSRLSRYLVGRAV